MGDQAPAAPFPQDQPKGQKMARFTKSNRSAEAAMAATKIRKNTSFPARKADAAMDVIFGEFYAWPSSS